MTDQPGLVVEDITVAYRNGTTALKHASFVAPRGSITALVGVNGAGKSTIFKAIMGFVPLVGGAISILGQAGRQAQRQNRIAYVPQSEDVDWNFPVLVEDVVMMGRFGHMNMLRIPRQIDRDKVAAALSRVDMTGFAKRQIGELSGGQKKRVFLARALAQEGEVILLDEPFTGVDVTTEDAIIGLLRDLRDEGKVILVSTHNLGSVPEFCDRTVLVKGTVIAAGPTAEVFTREKLEIAFGGVLRHFVLSGPGLHADDDPRHLSVLTDDERPLVFYGEKGNEAHQQSSPAND
jgi:manganese/iron transport system ATP-binding protein